MISQGGRAIFRLPQVSLQGLGGRRAGLTSSKLERVTAPYNVFQNRRIIDLAFKPGLLTPIICRAYAVQPVSRPKAHTGRTTAAARKAPTTSKTRAAKKPAPKTNARKARPKAKPSTKPKAAKKAKAKPKPRSKKLTEAQKEAALIKKLKTTALKPPSGRPQTAWRVLVEEASKDGRVHPGPQMKTLAEEYKQFTPERLEQYNHIANQNKAANEKAYRQWVESHSPAAIRDANFARLNLKRRNAKGNHPKIQDHRQVKRLLSSHVFFVKDRFASGDLKGLKGPEALKLVSREWKGLLDSEKKPYEDAAKQDQARYRQEFKSVYNMDPKRSRAAAAA